MKSFITLVTTLLLLFFQGAAAGQQAAAQPLSCRDPSSTLMWKVEGNHSRVYLFGSIHVGRADFYPLPAVIESAYHNARYVVFEVDPNSLADPSVAADIQTQGILPDGKTLNDVVSKQVVDDLNQTLAGIGLPANSFIRFQPWFITILLGNLQMMSLGYMPDQGIEMHLLKEKTKQAQILQLESVQQQIGFLKRLNGETFLAYTLKDFNDGREKIPQMINAWRCADQETLKNLIFDETEAERNDPEMQKLMDMLFFERDKHMARVIRGYLDHGEGDYFVTVGAGHLIGKGSVVDILDDDYTVVNIKKSH